MTTPVGLTLTGIRSAKSAGATYNGRRRVRSSAIRALGGTPVARDGLVRFGLGEPVAQLPIQINVVEEAALFEERALDPADEIFDAPFLLRPVRPAHLDTDAEIERHTRKVGFHSVTMPSRPHLSAIVFGRSKTATSGILPKAARCSTNARTSVSTRSSGTSETSTQRST